MKHLCCSKIAAFFFAISLFLYASVNDKSAIVYYGKNISYPMVGIHDYIIVEPSNIDTYTHGFRVYKDKMYAYVSIGEVDKETPFEKKIRKSWIMGKNSAWHSKIMDITNREYQNFIFDNIINPYINKGYKNFFFDTLDSYKLVVKSKKKQKIYENALINIIKTFHKRYPKAKLILNRGFEIIDRVHNYIRAVLFESYFEGVGGESLSYKKVSPQDRKWLDKYLKRIKSYNLDIICVDYLPPKKLFSKQADMLVEKLKQKGFIPYISVKDLDIYGKSSKNPIKREVFTLIDTKTVQKMLLESHEYGALPLEYYGYIQKLYDIKNGFPDIKYMHRYAGVVIWLRNDYDNPQKLINWLLKLKQNGIKFVFANSFGFPTSSILNKLGILVQDFQQPPNNKNRIVAKDKMVGYEVSPPLGYNGSYISIKNGKALLTLADKTNRKTTLSAIMPWGGYAISNSFMVTIGEDNLWVINPFKFFLKALRLKPLRFIPDPTTQNGKRLLFGHIDGDGIMNRVEWDPKKFSGQIILDEILKKYPLPTTVSIVGAEVDPNGLYPKISSKLQKIVKEIYKLPHIEPATHTFSHPFFWQKVKNGILPLKYRLKIKGYKFSIDYEIKGMIDEINHKYLPKDKYPKCKTILWSGDCNPKADVLKYVYKHNYLNMNGGDTYITNDHPWMAYIAPYGIEKGNFYQIYTGAQDENVYTNDWTGPFWGFKKVIQTFNLTNSPRRFKPIDIYYHYYAGSKRASLNALKYVYNWAIKQDAMPVFASEYIPKVMDYYTVSIAKDGQQTLLTGFRDLKNIRVEKKGAIIDLIHSKNIAGYNHFETHTYIHVGTENRVILSNNFAKQKANIPYLISSNGKTLQYKTTNDNIKYTFKSYLPLNIEFFLPKKCNFQLSKGSKSVEKMGSRVKVQYKNLKEGYLRVRCLR